MKRKILSTMTIMLAFALLVSACAAAPTVSTPQSQTSPKAQGHPTVTADELQQMKSLLQTEMAQASQDVKGILETATTRLDSLINDIASGKAVSDTDINTAFAYAHYALAKHYLGMATTSLEDSNYDLVGFDLNAAAGHVQEGLVWNGYTLTATDMATIQRAQQTASQLSVNTPANDPAIGAAQTDLESLSILIHQLGVELGAEQ